MKRLDRRNLFPGPHEECDARISEMAAAALDHDAHRRQLQARNTELVEERRALQVELDRQVRKRLATELDLEGLEDRITDLHEKTLANIASGNAAFTACGWCGHASGTAEEARAHVLRCKRNPPVAAFDILHDLAANALKAIDGLVFQRQEDGTVQVTKPEHWGLVVVALDDLRRAVRSSR